MDRRAFRFRHRGEELMVVSVPLEVPARGRLSPAETAVARAIVAGASNAEIAAERRSSVRTVANQVASIFRRLGVTSRGELASRLATMDFASAGERKR